MTTYKYPIIPPMTANNVPSPYVISASYELLSGISAAYEGFNCAGGLTHSANGVTTGILTIDLGDSNEKLVTQYAIGAQGGYTSRAPKNWTFEGSNDNINWTVLDTKTDITSYNGSTPNLYPVSNANYRYYRLNITANNGSSYLVMGALQLFEDITPSIDAPYNYLTLNGLDQYVSIPRAVKDDFTIEFKFRSTKGVGTGTDWYNGAGLIDGEVGGSTNDFGTSLNADGKVLTGTGGGDVTLVSQPGLNDGTWHHVAFTRKSSNGALVQYVDGIPLKYGTGRTGELTAPSILTIGRISTGGNFFEGDIGEIRLWNIVRTKEQINADINTIFNIRGLSNLVAYYKTVNASILVDSSLRSNNGTMFNAPTFTDNNSEATPKSMGTLATVTLISPTNNITADVPVSFVAQYDDVELNDTTSFIFEVDVVSTFNSTRKQTLDVGIVTNGSQKTFTPTLQGGFYFWRVTATNAMGIVSSSINSVQIDGPIPRILYEYENVAILYSKPLARVLYEYENLIFIPKEVLLMHMDSYLNNNKLFKDEKGHSTKLMNVYGNTKIKTTKSKFGGSSALFDGNGDYLKCLPRTYGTSDFTMEAWIYMNTMPTSDAWATSWSSHMSIMGVGSYGASDGCNLVLGATKLILQSNNEQILSGLHGITTGSWHHVAVTRSGNTFNLFVDGVVKATTTNSNVMGRGEYTYIGSETGEGAWFDGYMDEVRISTIARWTSGFTPNASAYSHDIYTWLLLHMDGTDESVLFQDVDSPLMLSDPLNKTDIRKFGQSSTYFDGVDDGVFLCPSNDWDLENQDFTIDGWFNFEVNNKGYQILMTNSIRGIDCSGWKLYLESDNTLHFIATTNGGGWNVILASGLVPAINTWMHIAVVRNGNIFTLYVDGIPKATQTYTDTIQIVNSNLGIGADTYNLVRCFKGYMDELHINKGAAKWTSSFTPPTEPYEKPLLTSQYIYDNLVLPVPLMTSQYYYDNLVKQAFTAMSFYDNVGILITPTGTAGMSFYENVVLGGNIRALSFYDNIAFENTGIQKRTLYFYDNVKFEDLPAIGRGLYFYDEITPDYRPRPGNFSGFTWITHGGAIYDYKVVTVDGKAQVVAYVVSADEWNSFTAKVNEFRHYKYMDQYEFTQVAIDDIFTKEIIDEAIQAVNDMGFSEPLNPALVTDEIFKTALRDNLNSIE